MSEVELPGRLEREHEATVEEVRELMGASTPHFALQVRNRIRRLIDPLPADHPARLLGEQEIDRLNRLAFEGETRGPVQEGELPLPSLRERIEPGDTDL